MPGPSARPGFRFLDGGERAQVQRRAESARLLDGDLRRLRDAGGAVQLLERAEEARLLVLLAAHRAQHALRFDGARDLRAELGGDALFLVGEGRLAIDG